MSDSTLSKFYRDAGLAAVHVPHGWRATFSTLMNKAAAEAEREGDRAVVDLMLAHVPEGVEPIYNRYLYLPRRRAIAQAWADELLQGAPLPSALIDGERGTSRVATARRQKLDRLLAPRANARSAPVELARTRA